MKEEWKVYIKGVQCRGNEVIKTLTDLGAINSVSYEGDNPQCLYYINHKGIVDYSRLDIENGQLVIDNYCEIKLSEKWNDGDILFNETNNRFAVFKNECKNVPDTFWSCFSIGDGWSMIHQIEYKRNFRLATNSEIAQFYECLHAINRDCDAENKIVIDYKWKPKM